MSVVFFPIGATRVSPAAGSQQNAILGNSNRGSFADNIGTIHTPASIRNPYTRMATNDRGASTYASRINGADGNCIVDVPAASGAGAFEDLSDVDHLEDGDEVNMRMTHGAGGTTQINSTQCVVFNADINTVTRTGCSDHDTISTASTTFFYAIGGRMAAGNLVSTNEEMEIQSSMTAKNFLMRAGTNTRASSATTAGLYINGAPGNLDVSFPASTTGTQEDFSDTDQLVNGDDVCLYITLGIGTGNFRLNGGGWTVDLETSDGKWQIWSGQSGGAAESTFNASATHYIPLGGQITSDYTATEAETQIEANIGFSASRLTTKVTANTVLADSTLTFRINSADGNLAAILTAATPGYFQDLSDTDQVLPGDNLNYSLVVGAGGTSLNLSGIGMLAASRPDINEFAYWQYSPV